MQNNCSFIYQDTLQCISFKMPFKTLKAGKRADTIKYWFT